MFDAQSTFSPRGIGKADEYDIGQHDSFTEDCHAVSGQVPYIYRL